MPQVSLRATPTQTSWASKRRWLAGTCTCKPHTPPGNCGPTGLAIKTVIITPSGACVDNFTHLWMMDVYLSVLVACTHDDLVMSVSVHHWQKICKQSLALKSQTLGTSHTPASNPSIQQTIHTPNTNNPQYSLLQQKTNGHQTHSPA